MAQVDRDNLRALISASGRSARAISLGAKLGATAVKDILSGKSRDPGASTLAAIAQELNVPVSDLLDGTELLPSMTNQTHVKLVPRLLPVRYRVQAGLWYEIDTEEPPEQVSLPVSSYPKYAAYPQWLEKVVGDSADLKFQPGAFLHVVDAIELGYAPKDGDWVVIERRRDQGAVRERTVKQIEITNGCVLLQPRSTNPKWREPLGLVAGARNHADVEVEIVGLVVGWYNFV
jgi:transcriptional regulator with XRE-family HTH domain